MLMAEFLLFHKFLLSMLLLVHLFLSLLAVLMHELKQDITGVGFAGVYVVNDKYIL